jgi:hypothetical protein
VVAPDLIGHGDSAAVRGDYSLGAHASSIRDLLLDFFEATEPARIEDADWGEIVGERSPRRRLLRDAAA